MPKPKAIIQKLPPEKREVTVIERHASFSGPLPPPSILEDYDRVCPGAADRIIKMAEKEQKVNLLAIVLGTFTFTMTLVLIGMAIYFNQPLTAAIIFGLIAVSQLIIGKNSKK